MINSYSMLFGMFL